MLRRPMLGRPMVLRVRPLAVMMLVLGTVVSVMTLAALLIHDQSLKGVWGKRENGSPDYRKKPPAPQRV